MATPVTTTPRATRVLAGVGSAAVANALGHACDELRSRAAWSIVTANAASSEVGTACGGSDAAGAECARSHPAVPTSTHSAAAMAMTDRDRGSLHASLNRATEILEGRCGAA